MLPSAPAQTIEDFFSQQKSQDLLRFITCGSVDDGKSTLIGRLLWESQQLFDDQLSALQAESRKYGTQGNDLDFSLLVDGLAAEREQGITIDVAYRFFATTKRKFIVADTPGHEQYTRNMITGASTADAAILLVDARSGLLTQTRRHAFLTSLIGIRHIALAVNKIDLVDFSQETFNTIKEAFEHFALPLGFSSTTAIPISALKGDNITEPSANTPWYGGATLLQTLESINVARSDSDAAVFPVQWVNHPNPDFRGYCGTVEQGIIKVGDEVRVTASGQKAVVSRIVTMDGALQTVDCGKAVSLCLHPEIDVSRGDIISSAADPLQMTDQFEATLVWLTEDSGFAGRVYDLKLSTQWTSASITNIKHRIDINTLVHEASKKLQLNDISICNLSTAKPVAFDKYANCRSLGSFILVDRFTNATVAAGMINHNLRRAQNVHKQVLSITRNARERLNGHQSKVVWFTGLSGAGKSTLANALEIHLHELGIRTYILDGDNIRQGLNKDLGFTEADRIENIRRIAEISKLMLDAGIIVMTAFISPFIRDRKMARDLIGHENFIEIFVDTPLEVCEQRDTKGLYKKARAGEIINMTGINSPYEAPERPDLKIDSSREPISEIVAKLSKLVSQKGIGGLH